MQNHSIMCHCNSLCLFKLGIVNLNICILDTFPNLDWEDFEYTQEN